MALTLASAGPAVMGFAVVAAVVLIAVLLKDA
jgi:hypothetical protein